MTAYTSVFGSDTVPPSGYAYAAVSLTADTTFMWPETSNGANLVADIMEVTASAAYAITMPNATEVSTGRDVLIRNVGAFTVTVKDSAGSVLATVLSGVAKYLYLTSNATAAGTWSVFTFGTGTSAADASALAGYGMKVTGSTLSQDTPVTSKSANYTVTSSDRAGTITFTNSGVVTLSMPSSASVGNGFFVSVTNQGTGTVTIDPNSTETVDGATTKDLAPGESCILVTNATGWVTIGYGRSTQFQFTKLVLDISAGTPFTLTSTQAQNKLIQFIGTVTGAVTVNVPAVVAIYYIECSYTGAFSTTVKTAAGSGVALTANDRAILYCDGTNVVSAQTATTPAANLSGGAAGEVVYQTGIGTTGYSAVGTTGQVFISGGVGAPTWSDLGLITDSYSSKVLPVDADELPLSDSAASFAGKKTTFTNLYSWIASKISSVGLSANLAFTGTGNRITGDFSNATIANRVMFQTSTVNGNTSTGAVPNGTGTGAGYAAWNAADPTNASLANFTINATDVRIVSAFSGSGSYLPMTFYTGGSERLRIDTSGNVGIGAAPATDLDINKTKVAGSTAIRSYNSDTGGTSSAAVSALQGSVNTQLVSYGNVQGAVGTSSNHPMLVITNNTERMRIDTVGNFGVGCQAGANIKNRVQGITSGNTSYYALWVQDATPTALFYVRDDGAALVVGPTGSLGYGTGAGGTVTQATSRTTAVTLNKPTGRITLFTAAGTATWQTFSVNNSLVSGSDTVVFAFSNASNVYNAVVSSIGTGSFNISFAAVSGTASDTPNINFAIIKGATA